MSFTSAEEPLEESLLLGLFILFGGLGSFLLFFLGFRLLGLETVLLTIIIHPLLLAHGTEALGVGAVRRVFLVLCLLLGGRLSFGFRLLLLLGYLRCHTGFVAKRELLFVPLINVMIAMSHSVFINRRSLKKSVRAIRKAGERLRKGHSMVIFPEGTRSKTGKIGVFKHGAFRMATESGADIVPVTVKGLRDSFEDRKHVL